MSYALIPLPPPTTMNTQVVSVAHARAPLPEPIASNPALLEQGTAGAPPHVKEALQAHARELLAGLAATVSELQPEMHMLSEVR